MPGDVKSHASEHGARNGESKERQTSTKYIGADADAEDLKAVQDIISRYIDQMLHGCGNVNCKQTLCNNGRQNTQDRPIRKYTPRSARTIALTLASGPRPRSRLCAKKPQSESSAGSVAAEGVRDPSSVIQLLADTDSIKLLCDSTRSDCVDSSQRATMPQHLNDADSLRRSHAVLDHAERICSRIVDDDEEMLQVNMAIAHGVYDCMRELLRTLPAQQGSEQDDLDEWQTVNANVHAGFAYPQSMSKWYVEHCKMRIDFFDSLESLPRYQLLRRCLSLVNRRVLAEHNAAPMSKLAKKLSADKILYLSIGQWTVRQCSPRELFALIIWLKRVFLSEWEGDILLRKDNISLTCLKLLDAWYGHPTWAPPLDNEDQVHFRAIPAVAARSDAVDVARAWLEASTIIEEDGERPVHLLDFGYLFTTAQRATYFRTLNHLRMQQAHLEAEKSASLRNRAARNAIDPAADTRLKYLEDHYLLLNIERSNIISDSFDQLWQRRSGELLRPLRVRLGEMDTFEIGHDLGGVQIEFFNLLCREVLSEQAGMFNTDLATGLSYFRPGSLQPSYMFELLGLLFGLAIYNGITLPINLPVCFYTRLLGRGHQGYSSLKDAWPAMFKVFGDIARGNIPDMECVYALEANGVRLAISSFEHEPESENPKVIARVAEATAIVHHPEVDREADIDYQPQTSSPAAAPVIDAQSLDWPGWSFEASPASEPVDLTAENKWDYINNYTDWLLYASVARQWQHFLIGFRRIIPAAHLRMFSDRQLQSIVEGTKHISIPDLRKATIYEGYTPNSRYINTFWSLVASWPESRQNQLLKFVTAAERVPVGGAGALTFKIQRVSHPGAEESLPTSSTCFGTLMLPRYENGEVLETKLMVALDMGGEGFGTG